MAYPTAWTNNPIYDPEKTPRLLLEAFADPKCNTDSQAAVKLGVSKNTVWEWKKIHPEFKKAHEIGKTWAEARRAQVYEELVESGAKFNSSWAEFSYKRAFGTMADIETHVGETEDEKIAHYGATLEALKAKHLKSE